MTRSRNCASAHGDVLDGLTRHRFRKEANKIALMTGLERNADFTVRLKTADSGPVPCARVDNDKWPFCFVDRDPRGRNNPHKAVIYGALQLATVDDELDLNNRERAAQFPLNVHDIDCPAAAVHPKTARYAGRYRRGSRSRGRTGRVDELGVPIEVSGDVMLVPCA